MSLEDVTEQLRGKVGDHSPVSAIIKIDFGDDGIVCIDGTATPPVVDNTDRDADCTIVVDTATFQEIVDGAASAQMAFMSGKLRIEGDMGIAMQVASLMS